MAGPSTVTPSARTSSTPGSGWSRGDTGHPGPYDLGWKDTIDLRPTEQATIITKFDGYRGRYVFHCHNLEHEDMAMMANLLVT